MSKLSPARVRFAPSPTGHQHLGGIRSALFNWLYARHTDGRFIVRIEDTDRARLVPEAVETLDQSLAWLGLNPDEGLEAGGKFGPYVQSERLDIYKQYANQLLESGALYRSWETPEQLAEAREAAKAAKQPYRYQADQFSQDGDINQPHVLRFRIDPKAGEVSWDDAVRGNISFNAADLDDFVAIKSDGYPTYHFASVVDDHLMEITHLLRADEWIPSTPKHILLYRAFGWEPPVFAHLPQVLGADGAKLSKRHGAESALTYRDRGYLPVAIINFLAGLGFNDGTDQEIYSVDELIKSFELDRIHKSPAVFDADRLDWINGRYIRQLDVKELDRLSADFWPHQAKEAEDDYRIKVLGLVHERLKFLAELPELTEFFFSDPQVDTALIKLEKPAEALTAVIASLQDSDFSEADLEARLRPLAEKLGVKTGQLFGLIRVSITGRTAAPGLFETLNTLGETVSLRRLQAVAEKL